MRTFAGFMALGLSIVLVSAATGADSMANLVEGKAFKQCLREMKNADPAVREHAIELVVRFGKEAKEAVPDLVQRLHDGDTGVATKAIMALRIIGVESKDKDFNGMVTGLMSTLQTGSMFGRLQAAYTLTALGPDAKAAIKPLVTVTIREPISWELRKAGIVALGRVAQDKNGPDSSVIRGLTTALKDDCAPVRLQAIMALGMLGKPKEADVVALKHALDLAIRKPDQDPPVSIWCRVLQSRLEASRVEANIAYLESRLLKSTDPQTRAHAAQGLGFLGEKVKPKIPYLIEALKDSDSNVASAAAGSLGNLKEFLTGPTIESIAKLVEDQQIDTIARCHALEALGAIGGKFKIRLMLDTMRDKDAHVGGAAAASLAQLQKELSAQDMVAIAAQLGDKALKSEVRARAATLLGVLGKQAKAQIPALIEALADKDIVVIGSAILAIPRMGKDADTALIALRRLMFHEETSIKDAASRAVVEITKELEKR